MPINSLTLKTFSLVCFLLVSSIGAGLAGIHYLRASVVEYEHTLERQVANERDIKAALVGFKTQVQEWKNTLLRGTNLEQRDKYWGRFQARQLEVGGQIDALLLNMADSDARVLVEDFKLAHEQMGAGYENGFNAYVESGNQSAIGDSAVKGMDREPAKLLDEAATMLEEQVFQAVLAAQNTASSAVRSSYIFLAVIAVLGLVGAGWLARSISRQIGGDPKVALESIRRIADGDMSQPVPLYKNDTHSVMAGMEQMRQSLIDVISQVRLSSDHIAAGSTEIANSSADQSQRVDELASSLEQTAASMEELGSTVSQNAKNAGQADALAKSASLVAKAGGEVVAEVVDTMKEINSSAQQIVDIIAVIDSIAFQTNLLALNAAVEAARAADQGRGFAVVATEVRALAHRSSDAANEIKELINTSVERVEKGSRLVDRAGVTMNEVVQSISSVTELMGNISHASTEQSEAVRQVGQAVTQMDQATQQSASKVEQSAASATSLRTQSAELVEAVSQFQLGSDKTNTTDSAL